MAHIKNRTTGQWWRYDDDMVEEIGPNPTSHLEDHGILASHAGPYQATSAPGARPGLKRSASTGKKSTFDFTAQRVSSIFPCKNPHHRGCKNFKQKCFRTRGTRYRRCRHLCLCVEYMRVYKYMFQVIYTQISMRRQSSPDLQPNSPTKTNRQARRQASNVQHQCSSVR